ncbi:hypothetical protein H8S95_17790 [Pontibacter sp. KCTC 32443]|uniref:hypothetical protein n=1 Tax=Pontibacter TaxID=323449 RepID=UPI00164E4C7A|nr:MULTISPECIES: hypothetical protein [Pontibacter]MBC5775932.1 hypothetical protein [Pontibacter sp. KCTC 32443]
MYKYLFIVLVIVCFACKERKQHEAIVDENPEPELTYTLKQRGGYFKGIIFSVRHGMSRDKYDKDVEIFSDGTFYYRLRERYEPIIKANYTGKLDSASMDRVYAILDSIDFNKLKFPEGDAEDAHEVNIYFTMYNGGLSMKGYLDEEIMKNIWNLMELVEAQEMKKSDNHRFRTAKDVIISPPEEFKPKDYNKLLDSL